MATKERPYHRFLRRMPMNRIDVWLRCLGRNEAFGHVRIRSPDCRDIYPMQRWKRETTK